MLRLSATLDSHIWQHHWLAAKLDYKSEKLLLLCTGPLKPKVATKKNQIRDYFHKKGLGEGFILINVVTIFL